MEVLPNRKPFYTRGIKTLKVVLKYSKICLVLDIHQWQIPKKSSALENRHTNFRVLASELNTARGTIQYIVVDILDIRRVAASSKRSDFRSKTPSENGY